MNAREYTRDDQVKAWPSRIPSLKGMSATSNGASRRFAALTGLVEIMAGTN